jgi:hypothetical protein
MSTCKLATVGDPCPDCGAPLRSEACCSCDGADASPFFICEECAAEASYSCVPIWLSASLRHLTKKWPGGIIGTVQGAIQQPIP